MRRNSYRIHKFTQKFIAEKRLPQNSQNSQKFIAEKRLPQNTQISQKFIAEKRLPQNSQNSQKFIAEKKLPQISRIYTDASKLFCEFREFCGSFYVI